MPSPAPGRQLPLWLAIAIALPCGSTAVLFIKASHLPPLWLAAGRLLLASAFILPLALTEQRQHGTGWSRQDVRLAVVPALALAAHFGFWIVGARLAPAVDGSLIGNFLPVVMPLVVFVLTRDLPSGRECWASGIGLLGMAAMAAFSGHGSAFPHAAWGDLLCAVSIVLVAIYLALARHRRSTQLWSYLVPVYAIAGIADAAIAWAHDGLPRLPPRELLLVTGLAIFPTMIAHSIYNRAMMELRPNTIGLLNLLQCPLSGLGAWLLWREHPGPGFWCACVGVLGAYAVLMHGWWRQPRQPPQALADAA